MNLALKIAKNELRILTYRFGKYRKSLFIILFSLGLFWALYLGPFTLSMVIPEFIKLFPDFTYYIFVDFVEYTFMGIFLFAVMFPLYDLYRKKEIGYLETVLASPIKPRDLFIGDILWRIPIQFLLVLLFSPFITGSLAMLYSLNYLHFFLISIILFTLILSGNVTGKLLANIIENKMIKNVKVRKNNKLILYLMSFSVIALFYLVRFSLSAFLLNPELKKWLIFIPSFWYSNIVLFLINPLSISILTVLSIILALCFPVLIIFISYKLASPIFIIDNYKNEERVKKKNKKDIFDYFAKIIISKEKNLMILQSKIFFRKEENVNKLIYIFFFTFFLGIVVSLSWSQPWTITAGFHDKLLIILIMAWMGGFIFGLLMGINIFINSRELLFLFKRSPKGIKSFMVSYMFLMIYLIIFFNVILTIIFIFLFQFSLIESIIYFIFYFLYSMSTVLLAIGIQCFKPLFDEHTNTALFHIYLIFLVQITSFFISYCIYVPQIPVSIEASIGLTNFTIIQFVLICGLSAIIYIFGFFKIQAIE